jgi:hypothetical protein
MSTTPGHRVLDKDTLDLIAKVRLHGQVMQELIQEVKLHTLNLRNGGNAADIKRANHAEPERWTALARTHFQEGLMCLTRAVAMPEHF